MKVIDVVAAVLVVVGALNWGLVAIARFDLVAALFGHMSVLSRIVYSLVGLSAVYGTLRWLSAPRQWARVSEAR